MADISDLIETLAGALGLPRRLVEETARYLREAKLLPDDENKQATAGHAGVLLLALMAAPVPRDAPNNVQIYDQLPLGEVAVGGFMPDGRFEGERAADDDPLLQDLNDLGETFGEFLVGLIWTLIEAPDAIPVPARITVGGGPGTIYATVDFLVSVGGIDRGCMVQFNLVPFGGGRLPDDAAVARLDVSASAPGEIFQILRDLFAGDSDSPHEATVSRAVVAGHRSANRSRS